LPAAKKPEGQKPEGERIAKVIARAGVCSRRDAEKLILEGRVKLDGVVVTSGGTDQNAGSNIIRDRPPAGETGSDNAV